MKKGHRTRNLMPYICPYAIIKSKNAKFIKAIINNKISWYSNSTMTINEQEKSELEEIYQTLLNNDKVKQMMEIPMHRGSNCYIHSFKVAKLAIKRALTKKSADLKILLYAAIFHDYYLYDWRKDRSKIKHHGKNHPYLAASQAKRDFDIPLESMEIIKAHMWPLNFKEFPRTREAKILTISDKRIATKEALTSKRFKLKRREKELKYISRLFDK